MSIKKTDRLLALLDKMVDFYEKLIASGESTPADRETIRKLLNDNGIHAALENSRGDVSKLRLDNLGPLPFQKETKAA